MFKVKFYEDKQGNKPIVEYLSALRKKAATSKNERIKLKKISEYIEVLKEHGTRAGEPYVKHIDGDIWELRPTDDRIFFFYWKDNLFILLHHFEKSTRKTPLREIEQAKRNMEDFIERSNLNEKG
ncbi:MAG: type II toxin-antitoxin system RelE/ParE family toxin [Oscillospiraceae bacterium]|nr:type II toxin-antitoxin system RelE/ParE family toxin [Oscillospiraceae bacterium]